MIAGLNAHAPSRIRWGEGESVLGSIDEGKAINWALRLNIDWNFNSLAWYNGAENIISSASYLLHERK